jgi:hypothetical protein
MWYCEKCKREIVIYGVSMGTMEGDGLEEIRRTIEAENKLILFNPPPFGPYQCPKCFNQLVEK